MIAKELRNPALRTKFNVGDTFKVPPVVWEKFVKPHKMGLPNPKSVCCLVTAVGDKVIERQKPNGGGVNRKCKFCVTIDSPDIGVVDIWEEWMLDKLVLMYAAQAKAPGQ